MGKHNAGNERMKRRYFEYLKEARRYSEGTLDAAAKAIDRFEVHTNYRDFGAFHIAQAIAFKKHLSEQKAQASDNELSKATLHSTLMQMKRFFQWLAWQPGYKSRIGYSDCEYFNISDKDMRIATTRREQKFPTVEQVKHVINSMPQASEIDRRNRALMAFTLLTGARDGAIASMKLKHLDLVTKSVDQDAREVKTKFSKSFQTFFFPVGDEILVIVAEWIQYLREEKLWGNDDPLFPATRIVVGASRHFEASGLERTHWRTATPIRLIFRDAFRNAGIPYFNPHSFRKTLVQLGERLCKSAEEFKAWSQNLGHENALTTFLSYGEVGRHRQEEILRDLARPRQLVPDDVQELAAALVKKIQNSHVGSFSLEESVRNSSSPPEESNTAHAAAETYVSELKG
jgi:integrase